MEEKWVLDLRDQCREQNVKFFFKQWGGKNKKKTGRLLEGLEYNEMPTEEAQMLINNKIEQNRLKFAKEIDKDAGLRSCDSHSYQPNLYKGKTLVY